MKATFTKENHTGKITSNRKEKNFSAQYTLINRDLNELATLRIYSTNSRNYACIWVNSSDHNIHVSGGGFAGGYGYHRPSQATLSAMNDAGIVLDQDIGGVGESAMQEALLAIGSQLGYEGCKIIQAHA